MWEAAQVADKEGGGGGSHKTKKQKALQCVRKKSSTSGGVRCSGVVSDAAAAVDRCGKLRR